MGNLKKLAPFIICMLTLLCCSSCTKNECVGYWKGRGHGTEYASLGINKNGEFSLRIYPHKPDIPELYLGKMVTYEGTWTSEKNGEITLNSKRKTEVFQDQTSKGSDTSKQFFFRKDGSLCIGAPSYANPDFELIKRE